jgi:hypothetical protein
MVETEATEVPAATVGREARQPRWFSRLEREAFSPTELRVFLPAYGLPMRTYPEQSSRRAPRVLAGNQV